MFTGKSAVVTGAGSGIGAALAAAMVDRGASVVFADIDGDAAHRAALAATGPGDARSEAVDVVDATAVQRLVDGVVDRKGRLDYMFNNAGTAIGGETEELSLDHWNRIIDLNIRGVVHGVVAAYPIMVAQGDGHIVNTASLAGLLPGGLLTSYAMTKHAIVGLSLSLRSEAIAKGVRVTVLCPSAVETPLLDKESVGTFDGRRYVTKDQGVRRPLAPATLAAQALNAVEQNRPMLVTPGSARMAWRLGRLSPRLAESLGRRVIANQRKGTAPA
ncbi:MAG: hypothetical protein QOJ44_1605 [Acidimicrobiaceae bacterium]|nr:hypothetical protein [Acidimicrobiaceae bacterium]